MTRRTPTVLSFALVRCLRCRLTMLRLVLVVAVPLAAFLVFQLRLSAHAEDRSSRRPAGVNAEDDVSPVSDDVFANWSDLVERERILRVESVVGLGTPASTLIPRLLEIAEESETLRCAVTTALDEIDPLGVDRVPALLAYDYCEFAGGIDPVAALWNTGPRVIPNLAAALRDPNAEIRGRAMMLIARFARRAAAAAPVLTEIARDDAHPDADQAALALFFVAPETEGILPGVVRALAAGWSRASIPRPNEAELLAAFPDLVRRLGAMLHAADAETRAAAASALGGLRSDLSPAHEALTRALAHPDPEVRLLAAEILARHAPAIPGVAAEIARAFADPDSRPRAVEAIDELGSHAEPLRSLLVEALASGDIDARHWAMQALRALGAREEEGPMLLSILRDEDEPDWRRRAAAIELASIEGASGDALAVLCDELPRDGEVSVKEMCGYRSMIPIKGQQWAAWAIARFGESGADAVPALLAEVERCTDASNASARALLELGAAGEAALASMLAADDPRARFVAANAFFESPEHVRSAHSSLRRALLDSAPEVRACAAAAILAAGLGDEPTAGVLAQYATQSRAEIICVLASAEIPPAFRFNDPGSRWVERSLEASPEAFRPLERLLAGHPEFARSIGFARWRTTRDPLPLLDAIVRDVAEGYDHKLDEHLTPLGESARPALPRLAALVSHHELGARQAAIRALGALGPVAAEAVPALVQVVRENDLRLEAVEALGRIGPAAREALPTLHAALHDFELDIRRAAATSIDRIEGR